MGTPYSLPTENNISGKAGAGHYQIDFFLCCRSNEPLEFTSGYHSIDANHTLAIGSFRARRISLRSSSNGRPEAAMRPTPLHWLLKLPGGPLKDGSPYHPAQSAQWQLFHQSSVLAISTKIPHFRIMEIKSIKNRIKLGKSRKGPSDWMDIRLFVSFIQEFYCISYGADLFSNIIGDFRVEFLFNAMISSTMSRESAPKSSMK